MVLYDMFPFTGLDGTIKRNEDGTKTQPHFYANYLANKPNNDTTKPIRYIRTGKVYTDEELVKHKKNGVTLYNIFVLDCDTEEWTEIVEFMSQNSHLCKVDSDIAGRSHYYFLYDSTLPTGKLLLGDDRKLEFFNGHSGVYGVSEGNHTKTISYIASKAIPPSNRLIKFLKSLISQTPTKSIEVNKTVSERRYYELLDPNEFSIMMKEPTFLQPKFSTFLKLVTPKRYYEVLDVANTETIHPDKIPDGEGNNYLRDIRLQLLQAIDVSPELTENTLVLIGCYLWSSPVSYEYIKKGIEADKQEDMYQEGAENHTTSVTTKYGRQAYIFKVKDRRQYWIMELGVNDKDNPPPPYVLDLKNWQTECKKWISQETYLDPIYAKGINSSLKDEKEKIRLRQEKLIKAKHKEIELVKDKTIPGGLNLAHTVFNEYPTSEFLGWVNGYLDMSEYPYTVPSFTLNFLRNLAPIDKEFTYLLRFLRTFLTTNWKSSVILYFLGQGGTGKSTFLRYLTYLVGGQNMVISPSLREYISDKNGEVFTKALIFHEEYSKQGTKADFKRIDGIDKLYTGSDLVTIRQLYQNAYNIPTNGLIVKTDNLNSVDISLDNRRVFALKPQDKLKNCVWAYDTNPYFQLLIEAASFAQYLKNEVENLSQVEFSEIPFESTTTSDIHLNEYDDDMLMQLLILIAYRKSEEFVQYIRERSPMYRIVLTGREETGVAISTLVKFVKSLDPGFYVHNLSHYTSHIKELVTMKEAVTTQQVEGMPSKRDKRIILDSAFVNSIREVVTN